MSPFLKSMILGLLGDLAQGLEAEAAKVVDQAAQEFLLHSKAHVNSAKAAIEAIPDPREESASTASVPVVDIESANCPEPAK